MERATDHDMLCPERNIRPHDYYMNIGPLVADRVARLLHAEIASIDEQHVTQYESIIARTRAGSKNGSFTPSA